MANQCPVCDQPGLGCEPTSTGTRYCDHCGYFRGDYKILIPSSAVESIAAAIRAENRDGAVPLVDHQFVSRFTPRQEEARSAHQSWEYQLVS